MEFFSKGLLCSSQIRIAACSCINRKNRRSRKSKNMIIFEILIYLNSFFALFDCASYNTGMHISKLAAVAFIKYKNYMFFPYRMIWIFIYKYIKLLNSSNNDFIGVIISPFIPIFKLPFQNISISVRCYSSFFKSLILFYGLIVQIFTVNYKKHLINIRQTCGKLCCLK